MLPLGTFHDDLWARILDHVTGNNIWEMGLRALLIYLFALLLVRTGKARMLSEATIFDIILAFVLGSMLSRTINGSAPLLPTLVASILLVAVHALIGRIAYHSHPFGKIVKGDPEVLVRDGKIVEKATQRNHISEHDLDEAIYGNGLERVEDVKLARLERDGKISVVPKFRVLEVDVQAGVQRVRIEV